MNGKSFKISNYCEYIKSCFLTSVLSVVKRGELIYLAESSFHTLMSSITAPLFTARVIMRLVG